LLYKRKKGGAELYYKKTIATVRATIARMEPETRAEYSELKDKEVAPSSYILWMCDEIERMDTSSVDEAIKAGRWIGWVTAHIELAGVWNNRTTRDLIRSDRRDGYDKPHQK
jgi:hypothetical protein